MAKGPRQDRDETYVDQRVRAPCRSTGLTGSVAAGRKARQLAPSARRSRPTRRTPPVRGSPTDCGFTTSRTDVSRDPGQRWRSLLGCRRRAWSSPRSCSRVVLPDEVAATYGLSRSWVYELLARYRADGDAGLVARSKRPRTSPTKVADALEDEVVALRKLLAEEGLDAGAHTIHWHLSRRHDDVPSVSTIWRILNRRGLHRPPTPQAAHGLLRPLRSTLPNECWQADITHWRLADGTDVEILNVIDDHSRLVVASRALRTHQSRRRRRHLLRSRRQCTAFPASMLTDNGAIFTAAATPRPLRDRDRTRRARHHLQALPALPPPDLRQSRTLPPDPQDAGSPANPQPRPSPSSKPSSTASSTTTTTSRPHRALRPPHPRRGLRSAHQSHTPPPRHPTPPTSGVRHDNSRQSRQSSPSATDSRLHHIGIGRAHTNTRV